MRTARSITSGENFGDFLMLDPFSIEGASSKSGAVHFLIVDALPVHHAESVVEWLAEHEDAIGVFHLPSARAAAGLA
jgi:hypothetical protein